jgi:hypothetical protein
MRPEDMRKTYDDLVHAAILKYFTVETAPRQPDKWLVECPHCGDMWHLAKDSTHPGNILTLLNHARGHDKVEK